MMISVFGIYGALFSLGFFIYGKNLQAIILLFLTIIAFVWLWKHSKN